MKPSCIQRRLQHLVAPAAALALCIPIGAQTHKIAKPENVTRAVGIYEWTGDMAKPTASRLIPVSLYIDGKFEDAAEYKARPVPFAVETGNVYQLMKGGTIVGDLDLAFAKHFVEVAGVASAWDDGWFGYGTFVAPAEAKKSTLKPVAEIAKINGIDDDNDDRPHFSSRSAVPGSGGSATNVPSSTAGDTPAADPDRPTLHRPAGGTDSSGTASSGNTPDANDPDRPTLRRRSPEDAKKPVKGDQGSVTAAGPTPEDDPNRPTLHRGKPVGALNEDDIPKLMGLPGDADLHQIVAVSDPVDRAPHDFSRGWDDEQEHQAILARMQAAARTALTAYEAVNGATPTPPPPPVTPSPLDKRRPSSKMRHTLVKDAPPPQPEPLLEEQLTGYTLSYGGAATFVYSAHTDGLGPTLRFVTLVAQANGDSDPQIAVTSVTDADHLDRTPRMKLVDAVDAEASNRASLLFELRAQASRQFALYRVIGARAEQIFVTGSTR